MDKYDLIIWDNYPKFNEWVINLATLPRALHGYNGGALVKIFESKKEYKVWMRENGFGYLIPNSYTVDNVTFPCMFKSSYGHFGSGVKIAHSMNDINAYIHESHSPVGEYILEEVLTGSKLTELSAYGGSFMGNLTSLRCEIYHYDPEKLKTISRDAASGETFVAGQKLREASSSLVDCGLDIVKSVSKVVKAANYTGAFCVNMKFDHLGDFKFMEINSRMCSPLTSNSGLFISTYLPLAVKVSRRRLSSTNGWRNFRDIVLMEKRVLNSGGECYLREICNRTTQHFDLAYFIGNSQ